MKLRSVPVFLAVALAAATFAPPARAAGKNEELRVAMRKLWDDHVVWTRLYIVRALGDLPE
jgi:hypothetical protein